MPPATELQSASPEETERAGERLAARLRPGSVVALVGALGAGKTCFVRGLARGLGVNQIVSSPTFVLVNEYRGRLPVVHVDAYPTEGLAELLHLRLDEPIGGTRAAPATGADQLLALPPA